MDNFDEISLTKIFSKTMSAVSSSNSSENRTRVLLLGRVLFRVLVLVHHAAIGLHFILKDYSALMENPEFIKLAYFSNRYLTGWNFGMQISYMLLGLVCDYHEWNCIQHVPTARKLAGARDFLFTSVLFPNTAFVVAMFWGLHSIERELVLPKICDAVLTPLLNHSLHTLILVVVLLELALQPKYKKENERLNKAVMLAFLITYTLVLFYSYWETGRWIYPVYARMNAWQMTLFICGVFTSFFVFYEIQWALASRIWPPKEKKQ